MAYLNFIEKETYFDEFSSFYLSKCEEIKQNNILAKMKLSPFPILKKSKELFNLIVSKISSDVGDFQCIVEIALF